jgi:lysyl-tRNA synthetase, class II
MKSPTFQIDGVSTDRGSPFGSRNGSDQRQLKLKQLRAAGGDPFPHVTSPGRVPISALLEVEDPGGGEVRRGPRAYSIAGRVLTRRKHGRITFIDLQDQSGSIELCVKSDKLGADAYELMHQINVGDIIGAEGSLDVSRQGETTMIVERCVLMAKSLRQPPTEAPRKGGAEVAHIHREVDLMVDEGAREMFHLRSRTVMALREAMNDSGFVEVETPILQALPGGAHARPFVTHANSLDRTLFLRVAPELYLQRCVIGGLERVYDLGKCFRNEGVSHRHSPEFTMLEWSMCYTDYRELASFIETMIADVARTVLGTTKVEVGDRVIDLSPPWKRCSLRDALIEATGVDLLEASVAELAELLDEPSDPTAHWDAVVDALYAKLVEPRLIDPTIVFDFPVESLPLVKRHPDHPLLGEAFDVVIGGIEIASGDTALNDPEEQEERFLEQAKRATSEGEGIHPQDEQFARAMEYGLPPSAGAGLGVERLLLLLNGSDSVRDVIPFPAMTGRR